MRNEILKTIPFDTIRVSFKDCAYTTDIRVYEDESLYNAIFRLCEEMKVDMENINGWTLTGKTEKNTSQKTKVAFRKFTWGGVIALFPEMQGANFISEGKRCTYIGSYQCIGQHSDAHPSLITDLKPASKNEYKNLYDELIDIGYELSIIPFKEIQKWI